MENSYASLLDDDLEHVLPAYNAYVSLHMYSLRFHGCFHVCHVREGPKKVVRWKETLKSREHICMGKKIVSIITNAEVVCG